MSSSVIAKKRRNILKSEERNWTDATSASQGAATIAKDEYDLYLVSPQTKMYFANLEKLPSSTNDPS